MLSKCKIVIMSRFPIKEEEQKPSSLKCNETLTITSEKKGFQIIFKIIFYLIFLPIPIGLDNVI